MGIFANLAEQTEKEERPADSVSGSGNFIKESDIYIATIKAAYQTKSQKSKAVAVSLILDFGDNIPEYRETIWITNGDGLVHWKSSDGSKRHMRGFYLIDDLCYITTEKSLAEQDTEDKTIKIWNPDSKKEEPTSVPTLTELLGKKVAVAILKIKTNKQQKADDGSYVNTSEERFINQIDAVYHPELQCTYNEALGKSEKGSHWKEWLAKWKPDGVSKTQDKYQSVSTSPVANTSTPKRTGTSLFGKK